MSLLTMYPVRVRASLERALMYRRQDDMYALRGAKIATLGAEVVMHETVTIAVFPGTPPTKEPSGAELVAVYRLAAGPPAVPSGRVFVRLSEGIRFTARTDAFERLGYRVTEALGYAPHAGWLEGPSIADALRLLPKLARLRDVENVEPQMLTPAERKG
jgi:hypothetical protein